MKGSDFVEMSINIGGEPIKLNVKFDEQLEVRDAEREVKLYIEKKRKSRPEASDLELLAMAAFQFALWNQQLQKIQENALELVKQKIKQIDNQDISSPENTFSSFILH